MSMLLTLLSLGTDGKTFDELKKGLYLNGNKTIVADQYHEFDQLIRKSAGESELLIANQIYVMQKYQLKEDFKEIAVKKFASGVESVNFAQSNETAQIINRFVEQKTKQKIRNFVKSSMFNGNTRTFLVNAI